MNADSSTRQTDEDAQADRNIGPVLVSRDQIANRVAELGGDIAEQYAGREVTMLAVLTGSLVFLADLIRQMPVRMRIDVVSISSYPGTAIESQGVTFLSKLPDLTGKHVLVVDDILDSGQTMASLTRAIRESGAADVKSCVLLRKQREDLNRTIDADFIGFDIENKFVVGYGLDYDHFYRNLPDIRAISPPDRTENAS